MPHDWADLTIQDAARKLAARAVLLEDTADLLAGAICRMPGEALTQHLEGWVADLRRIARNLDTMSRVALDRDLRPDA